MNSTPQCSQKDMFATPLVIGGPIVLQLHLRGIRVPPNKTRKDQVTKNLNPKPNCHVPSFKNSKIWLTKLPNGKSLKRPLLITKPEFQEWKEKAVQSLESQLLSICQTECGATQPARSKLFAMLSRLPADDSVNDLVEGQWKVSPDLVPADQAGATIEITRLT